MEITAVRVEIPDGANIIIGQSHFIKTAEDIYEAVAGTVAEARFALAFNEASGPCLIRCEGNDDALREVAVRNAEAIGAGHVFVLLVRNAFPINLMGRLREVPEICTIFCATANPLEVVVARSAQGAGVVGVIDGSSPKGVETEADVVDRRGLLRHFGYKL